MDTNCVRDRGTIKNANQWLIEPDWLRVRARVVSVIFVHSEPQPFYRIRGYATLETSHELTWRVEAAML